MTISRYKIEKLIKGKITVNEISDSDLADFCIYANKRYRSGYPVISDQDYDFLYLSELKKRLPNHHLIKNIEPENEGFSEEKVLIPEPMLSIDKAYSYEEILKWIERIYKSISELNYDSERLILKATPKLDGFAGYDDG